MSMRSVQSGVPRNVRLYPWYALSFNAYFWMPVFVLYFLESMPLRDVLVLEAVYYLGVVTMEVPSGYFSDRVGRRPTLLLATAFLIIAYALFFLGGSFAVFAVAQVLLAAGLAFNSGTDTSLHFDSLSTLGRASEYDAREAIAARNALFASGVAAVAGGLIGLIDLRLVYALSALGAIVSLMLVLLMHEPRTHEQRIVPPGPVRQVGRCAGLLRQPVLGWTFACAVTLTVLNHVPYEFYQPYIDLALADFTRLQNGAPLAAGLHMGVVMILASAFARRSIAIRDRLGYTTLLLLAALLQVVITFTMGLVLHPLVLLLVLGRSLPRALTAAPINAAIAPRVPEVQRATFLSLQSLAGRLAFAAFLVGLSVIGREDGATGAGEVTWGALSTRLLVSSGAGLAFVIALWMIRPHDADDGADPAAR